MIGRRWASEEHSRVDIGRPMSLSGTCLLILPGHQVMHQMYTQTPPTYTHTHTLHTLTHTLTYISSENIY